MENIIKFQEGLTYEAIKPNTYKAKLLEFSVGKKYKPVGYFYLGGTLGYVNGQLCQIVGQGYYPVFTQGKNLFACAVCGTPINNHYTIQDLDNKELVNVGSECIHKVINPKIADMLVNYSVSVERKLKEQFRRPIKNEQLTQFLKDNLVYLNDVRNKRIDLELKNNPEYFYLEKYHTVMEKDKSGQLFGKKIVNTIVFKDKTKIDDYTFVYDTDKPKEYEYDVENWKNKNASNYRRGTFPSDDEIRTIIRKEGAEFREYKARNTYNYLVKNINIKQWNPETMKKAIYQDLAQDSKYDENILNMSIKWDKLTDQQLLDEKKTLKRLIDEYIQSIQRLYNDKEVRIY